VPPRETAPIPTAWEAGWDIQPIWKLQIRKILCPCCTGNQNLIPQSYSFSVGDSVNTCITILIQITQYSLQLKYDLESNTEVSLFHLP
jgi:hypothetical protein